jgi:hypothetical protein
MWHLLTYLRSIRFRRRLACAALVCPLLLLSACATLTPEGDVLAPPEGEILVTTQATSAPLNASWRKLFNGKNLQGWNTYLQGVGQNRDPKGVFKVENGMLHINDIPVNNKRQPFGYLITQQAYGNYHLRFQYRWGSKRFEPRANKKRDSGVIYHVNGGNKVWPRGAELQVQEGDTGDFWLIGGTTLNTTVAPRSSSPKRYRSGGLPHTTPPRSFIQIAKSHTRDSRGGWNTVELIVSGNEATHIVNGSVVNRGKLYNAGGNPLQRGRILFQVEGAEVYYRNIEIKAVAAPEVQPEPSSPEPSSSARITLFNGSNTNAWRPKKSGGKLWPIKNGALEVLPGAKVTANDIRTKQTFRDFKLHLEFQVPPSPAGTPEQARGNSGIYLQGRYEVQILDSYRRPLSGANDAGAIYGVRNASRNVSRPAGQWQRYDITFRAARYSGGRKIANARATVYWNGQLVQNNVVIPRPTQLGAPEGASAGPIVLQDHRKPVRYRNIWLQPLN